MYGHQISLSPHSCRLLLTVAAAAFLPQHYLEEEKVQTPIRCTAQVTEEGPQKALRIQWNVLLQTINVNETKDKKLVVYHDTTLLRTCGIDKPVSDLNYEQLPRYLKQFPLHFSSDVMGAGQNNKIPLLEELFQRFPTKPMNIELKTPTPSAMKEFSRLIKQYKRQEITIWGVAGSKMQELKNQNPDIENFYNASTTFKIFLLYITGLLPFWCLEPGFMEMPIYTQKSSNFIRKMRPDSPCTVSILIGLIKCISCLLGPMIRHLKKRGIITFLFVLNQQVDFQSAISKGCCGIMTDRPRHLNEYLSIESLLYMQS